MSEYTLQFISVGKTFWICFFSLFYGLGGISRKWLRRFVGPLWMMSGLILFSKLQGEFQWGILFYPILLCATLHMGYGGTDNVWIKIRKRFLVGSALSCSAIPIVVNSGLWGLFGLHCALCILASVSLGVFNPLRDARSEENLIAILSTLLVLFLI